MEQYANDKFMKKEEPQPGYLTCSGLGTEEKGIVQAQNKECGLQKLILDPLSHVCAARPRGGGILNGSGPLGECTDPNSDRVRLDAVLMVTCF